MLFDFAQIIFWITQAYLIGYSANKYLLVDSTLRLKFAPLTGVALTMIYSSFMWFNGFSTHVTTYGFVILVGVSFVNVIKEANLICYEYTERKHLSDCLRFNFLSNEHFPIFLGIALIAAHGSFIPFTEKLFQGYPLDRWGYLASSIYYSQEDIDFFQKALAGLIFNGDNRAFIQKPLLPAVLGQIDSRPAMELGLVLFSWMSPKEMYRLGNAWEVFFRCLHFLALYGLFSSFFKSRVVVFTFSLAITSGYWLQYLKDFNAWPHFSTMFFLIGLIAGLLFLRSDDSYQETLVNQDNTVSNFLPRDLRGFLSHLRDGIGWLYLIGFTMLIAHPEFALFLGGCIVLVIALDQKLRNRLVLRKTLIFELTVLLGLSYLVHPNIVDWVIRMAKMSPGMVGGIDFIARGIFDLFGTDASRSAFVSELLNNPSYILSDPINIANIIVGMHGFSYIEAFPASFVTSVFVGIFLASFVPRYFVRSSILDFTKGKKQLNKRQFTLAALTVLGFLFLTIISYATIRVGIVFKVIESNGISKMAVGVIVATLTRLYWISFKEQPHLLEKVKPILIMVLTLTVLFFLMLFKGSHGGTFRMLPYWGVLSGILLLSVLWFSKDVFLRGCALIFCSANLFFATTIFWSANTSGMENYANFYPNKDGFRHFEEMKIRSKYDYDYRPLIKNLEKCKLVFLDFPEANSEKRAPRFFVWNLMLFLESKQIPVFTSMPYRNAGLLGSPYFTGFKKDQIQTDCTVTQEMRAGRYSYKFIQNVPINRRY